MYGGENMWWSLIDGSVMFHDGPDELDSSSYPPLLHFRSSSNKDLQMLLAEDWRKCVQDCKASELILPLYKIKIYEEGKLCTIFKNEGRYSVLYTAHLLILYMFFDLTRAPCNSFLHPIFIGKSTILDGQ